MIKHGVVEPGRTPPENDQDDKAIEKLADCPSARIERSVKEGEARADQVPPDARTPGC